MERTSGSMTRIYVPRVKNKPKQSECNRVLANMVHSYNNSFNGYMFCEMRMRHSKWQYVKSDCNGGKKL